MRRPGVFVVLFLWSSMAAACINSIGTDRAGRRFEPGWEVGDELVESLGWYASRDARQWLDEESHRLAEAVREAPDFANRNDLAVNLIRQGALAPAMRLLVANERDFPERPETAANLGTALELAGFDDIALRWIRIGIRRNAHEHHGTEWLHARILEAKIAARSDSQYLQTHSITGIRFPADDLPPLPAAYPPGNDGRPVSPAMLNAALSYQLHERIQFVAPPDAVVANLLDDWATLNLAGGPVESAKALYGLAQRYGAQRTPLMAARLRRIDTILSRGTPAKQGACPICRETQVPPPPRPAPPPFDP